MMIAFERLSSHKLPDGSARRLNRPGERPADRLSRQILIEQTTVWVQSIASTVCGKAVFSTVRPESERGRPLGWAMQVSALDE